MGRRKKITVQVPEDLLRRAQKQSRDGVTGTVRKGLELLAASDIYDRIRQLRGKVHLTYDLEELRRDRR
ncbi:MAG: hypothetical protein DMF58_14710 [Acidobacteria bacterium]|nr:MAG: hypothetical protein DMF58_14710 [Acidobacteriota bacterium]